MSNNQIIRNPHVVSKFLPQGISIEKGGSSITLTKEEYLKILQKGIQTGYIHSQLGGFEPPMLKGTFVDISV